MLLVLAVALLAPAGLQADALSVTVTDTECIDEFVPSEGDSVFGYFVVFNKGISRSSDQRGIYLTVLAHLSSSFPHSCCAFDLDVRI
jgi:hypothetical protein